MKQLSPSLGCWLQHLPPLLHTYINTFGMYWAYLSFCIILCLRIEMYLFYEAISLIPLPHSKVNHYSLYSKTFSKLRQRGNIFVFQAHRNRLLCVKMYLTLQRISCYCVFLSKICFCYFPLPPFFPHLLVSFLPSYS